MNANLPSRGNRPLHHLVALAALFASAFGPALNAWGIAGPENVVLVVNAESWASTRLANEYARLRHIPASNVIYLEGLSSFERIDVDQFRQKILVPVLKTIETRNLVSQIDAIVYSADFPTTIDVRGDIGDRKLPPVLTPDAAINGLTYLYPFVLNKDVRYLDLRANLYARRTQADPDFRGVPERDESQKLVERRKNVPLMVQPPCFFRGSISWSPTGEPTAPEQGVRYLVSTMLSYTSGRGLSVSEAVGQLRRSAAADHTRPMGTVYFPFNGDVRSTTREWGFRPAATALEKLGVRAVVEAGVLPQGKSDVAGAVIGTAGFEWTHSASTILPGAICEHLTSFGGMLGQDAGQTPLIEFLRHGAAGSSGTVTEPYAIQAKFPTPFIQVAYANGLTLGEAFYQSVAGPYQLLVVGDVLCRPWARPLDVQVAGLPAEGPVRGSLRLVPSFVTPADAQAAPREEQPPAAPADAEGVPPVLFELFVDGCGRVAALPGTNFELDTTKLADGPHELVVVGQRGVPIPSVGRFTATMIVRNHADELTVEAPVERQVRWDRPIELQARLAGASRIEFRHLGRDIGHIEGAEGTLSLDLRKLGTGPVRLQPVGHMDSRDVWGTPLDFDIIPPPALPAQPLPAGTQLHDGLHLRVRAAAPVPVAATKADWLANAGVAADSPWSLDGWFEVPTTDVYQFQLEGDVANCRVLVDDQPLDWPRGQSWWFLPVQLQAGRHRLNIESTATNPPRLDVRFGGPGSRWLEGSRFRHLK